jgi:putative ABC transport system permease protein
MVIARGAVQKKIDTVKSSIGNTVSIAPAGVQGFEGGGEPLTTSQIDKIKNVAHISSISEMLQDRLTTNNSSLTSAIDAGSLGKRFNSNNGEHLEIIAPPSSGTVQKPDDNSNGTINKSFTPPITIIGTNNPATTSEIANNGTLKITSGGLFKADSTENVAVVGKDLAKKNNLKVGSTFTAYDTTFKVVAIYDTGTTFANNSVAIPLSVLQKLSEQDGQISTAVVKVDNISNVTGVYNAIKSKLGDAADVTNNLSEADSTLAPLENIKTISMYSLIGSVVAGSVIILLTMIMIVRERRREIGVLKAIGASNVKVVGQFMAEAVTFTGLGAVIGVVLGVVGGSPITKVLVNNASSASTNAGPMAMGGGPRVIRELGLSGQSLKDINAVVSWDILVYGLGAAVLIAIAGSAVAALLIAKVRPAEVMRAE